MSFVCYVSLLNVSPSNATRSRHGVQIGTGLHDIHNHGVIHRDIKAANLLLTSDNDDECHLKISDFGTAKAIENNLTNTIGAGTLAYMAPEVNYGHYTYKIDIWSAGVVLYHMLTGSPALLGGDGNPIVNLGFQRGDLMSGLTVQPLPGIKVSEACLNVLKRFLVCDPDKRIDWDEIICLEWLTEGKEERSLTIGDVDFKYWTKPVLGSGLSCKVFKGVKASTPEEAVAVKAFTREYVLTNSRLFRHEIQILEELKTQSHEEFVKYFGHVEGESHYLIYEYCNCTLASQIIGGVSETVAHSFMKQIGLFSPFFFYVVVVSCHCRSLSFMCFVQLLESRSCMNLVMSTGISSLSTSLSKGAVMVPCVLSSVTSVLQPRRINWITPGVELHISVLQR